MAKIKPCPFCGGEAECGSRYSGAYEYIMAYVECKKCKALLWGEGIDVYALTGKESERELIRQYHGEARRMAIDNWNKRTK